THPRSFRETTLGESFRDVILRRLGALQPQGERGHLVEYPQEAFHLQSVPGCAIYLNKIETRLQDPCTTN
ncbi:unnamed protein product, partial [Amoebophrya sp. A25]